jgi:nicotinate phosphoribosyltransferase
MTQKLHQPNPLEFTTDLAVAVADYYEYSMARANQQEGIAGRQAVFDFVVRGMPTTKVTGTFTHDGVRYDKLEKRDFLVNAGLEQITAYILNGRGTPALKHYLHTVQGISDQQFLDWTEHITFQGDVYAMEEGTIFFGQEAQLRIHERFEEAQVYESLLCNTVNPQTNVATTANDIASIAHKILLEGGSRRATSPQSALFNSRAARIGGFTASSNVAFGMAYGEKVGGTHGHSYVMLHADEYAAFKAQGEMFKDRVCFLLDTYNVETALQTAVRVIEEEDITHFAFRLDSGDLLAQAKWLHYTLKAQGIARDTYDLVVSDDLTAGKIAHLETSGADIDKYLVGTYVVNPPKPLGGVYKLAAYHDGMDWVLRGKLSEEPSKATLPGIKQTYRVTGADGFYRTDIIAFEGEDISDYLHRGDSVEALLKPIIIAGKQVYDFPTIEHISKRRVEQLSRFKDIATYEVTISDSVRAAQQTIINEHRLQYAAVEV